MRTLSDLIDKKQKQDKRNRELMENEFVLRMYKIEKEINKQFEKAKYVTGKRLTMRKQHESMYYFCFDIGDNNYRTLYIHGECNWDTLNVNSVFEVTLMDINYHYTEEEIKIIKKEIYLKDLNRMLIDWCKILTDKIIKK